MTTAADGPPQRLWLLRYPIVSCTILVGILGALAWIAGLETIVRWSFSAFALGVAGIEAVRMARQLRQQIFGIDILAIVAIVSTVAVGEVAASMIIVLMVAGGRALEDFATGRAQRELSALLNREPQTAHRRVDGSTTFEDVAAADVRAGDVVLVRSGEVVPVDGTLLTSTAVFDESSLTGESMPRNRMAGDEVLSGSVTGTVAATLTATATASDSDSQYQGIIALVKQAAANQAPVVRLADRYAIPFTVISLIIGGVAWFVTGDPVRFAEVLVLATPCPLVLAAPVAFMGGMSRAARNGIIVKGGGVLELLARARTAVFDKTGTLTSGTPTIARITALPPFDESELLTLVASAEKLSSHVLAASIVAAARQRGLELIDASTAIETDAQGVVATLQQHAVAVGTLAFIRGIAPEATASAVTGNELAIYVAVDGRFAGSIIATDPVRSNARGTITALRGLGVNDVVMLSGDARVTAVEVARAVGISTVQADCLPADKVNAVKSLRQGPVLMVGDGVNDAPVLVSADVGIAMGARGATAASESASAVILVDDLSLVVRAVAIGQDTVRIALQSIWLGMGLSVGLMLVAAFGAIPTVVGAGIQEIVDLATILNALRALHPHEQAAPRHPRET